VIVDLRSDTVTKPTPGMRRAMAEAEVGDDVYGEDPTVRRLEELAAERVGHEAAIFVPTGTMGNQIAINLLAPQGSEAIVEGSSHVYDWELGAMAAWSGVTPRVLRGRRGAPDPDEVEAEAAPKPYYDAPTSLLVLENTHNAAGGAAIPRETRRALLAAARRRGLSVHLDGARIFHAALATGEDPKEIAAGFDTVMFCLSKGLGAPVGSMLCASKPRIERARVVRKRMGGGMRQAGVLAAAGIYALTHHVERLAEDHARARRLAEALAEIGPFRLDPAEVETNIGIATIEPADRAPAVIEALRAEGVLAGLIGRGRVRFVTHLDVDDAGIEAALRAARAASRRL
jgi:Threonine aldolase